MGPRQALRSGSPQATQQALPQGHPSPSWKEQRGAQAVMAGDHPWTTSPAHSRNRASSGGGRALDEEEAESGGENTGLGPPASTS